jgi:hypothetical protein
MDKEEEIVFEVGKSQLTEHVKRICRRNLKVPCKCCIACPFLKAIVDIMKENKWKYNTIINNLL